MIAYTPQCRRAIERLAAFAACPERWCTIPGTPVFPDHWPEYALTIDGYRCVLYYVAMDDRLYCRLSITPTGSRFDPQEARRIAGWFGLGGAPVPADARAVVVVQEVGAPPASRSASGVEPSRDLSKS